MNPSTSSADDQWHEYHGYTVTVGATSRDGENWLPAIDVERDGRRVELDAPGSAVPYWATRAEALRAGIERARYLLDGRDGLLDERNPGCRG
ncbi:conserved hypothetical protein [Paraburkholderia piptadeniae]|uniref:DUF6566 domain-containing protein n=1 Tax=Paraburkholderia piptadeniae TaxID=1701573 RepID=A0A1N7RLC3_9BURK|nr:DUF6566 family protein [Paraburkholderia piptadeniae]SIT35926.1 conserved hypothetical protein [Paraburkholderia piptadeniae]